MRHMRLLLVLLTLVSFAAQAQEADLLVVKTGPDVVAAGSDVAYSVTVTNIGPDAAATISLDDNIPPGMTFVSATQDSGPVFVCSDPGVGFGGTVSCTAATLLSGESAGFTFVFNIPPATPPGSDFTNFATAASATFDPNEENNTGVAVTFTPAPPSSDVAVTKTGPSSAAPDTDVSFTIMITNAGPDAATTLSLDDTLPGTMTFVSLTHVSGPMLSCSTPSVGAGGTITCTTASFPAGDTTTYTLVAHIPPGAVSGDFFFNTATVSADNDTNEENNQSSAGVTVSSVDLSVVKTGPANVNATDDITYTIIVSNSGPDAATSVVLHDPLPPGTMLVSFVQDSGPAAVCDASIICSWSLLSSGSSAQFTLVIDPGLTTTVSNTATVSAESFDIDTSNNSSTVDTTITQQADLAVVKNGPATVTAGTTVTYTLTLTNNGPSNATGVSLTDAVPANATVASVTQESGPTFSCTVGPAVDCTLATFPSGASATFTFVFNVGSSASGSISNTADVTSATSDPAGGNESSTVISTVTTSADVSVDKSGPAAVASGSDVTYTVVVSNNGPSDAQNVSLADLFPPNTTFVSMNQSGPAFTCNTPPTLCTISTLVAGSSTTFTFVFNVDAGSSGTIDNTATVSSTTSDPNSANNSDGVTVGIDPGSTDLRITKTASGEPFRAGSLVTYTIVASNEGPNIAFGVTVTDELPAGTTLQSVSTTQGSCSGTTTVVCSLGTLAPSASATITIEARLPATLGEVSNTATISAANAETASADNSSTAVLAVTAEIPTASTLALSLLAIGLAAAAVFMMKR